MRRRIVFDGRPRRDRRKILRRVVELWRERLLLDHWSVDVELRSKPHSKDPDHVLASIKHNERYNDMAAVVYPRFWLETQDEQSRAMLHEMAHGMTNRVANLLARLPKAGLATEEEIEDAEENLVEHITNVVWDAYDR
jgi:hypothetical protein